MGLLYTGKNLRLYSGDFRKDGTTQYQIRFVDDAGKRVTRRAPADVDPIEWAKEMDSIVAQSGKIVADAWHMNVLMTCKFRSRRSEPKLKSSSKKSLPALNALRPS